VTADTELPFNWVTVCICMVEGKTCRQKPDIACSVSSCDEDEKGQGPQASAFRVSLGRAAAFNPAGCGRHKRCCVLHTLHKSQTSVCSGVPLERKIAKATV